MPRRGVAALLLITASAVPARAQLLHLVPQAGELGIDYRGFSLEQTDDYDMRDVQWQQWIRLPLAGVLFHPRILAYDLTLQPTFMRLRTGPTDQLRRARSRQLSYNLAMRALTATRFPVSFGSGSASGTRNGDYGEQRDFATSYRQAEVAWNTPMLPMRLSMRTRSNDDEWRAPFDEGIFARAERERELRLVAENSKTYVSLSELRFAEERSGLRFDWRRGDLAHRYRWGKGSSLATDANMHQVLGANRSTQGSWGQSAQIHHTAATTSSLTYAIGRTSAAGSATSTGHLSERFSYTPWRSFTASLLGSATQRSYDAGSEASVAVGPSASVTRTLLRRITLSYGGSALVERYRFRMTAGYALSVDERHRVDSSRRTLLRQRDVDTASLRVTSADYALEYVRGSDYQLVGTPGVTELYAVPGGRISIGDTLLVTYRFALPPSQGISALNWGYNASIAGFGGSLYYSRSARDLRAGDEAIVPIGLASSTILGARYAWSTPRYTCSVAAERREYDSRFLDYRTDDLAASLSVPITSWLAARAGANASRSLADGQHTATRTTSGGLTALAGHLRLDADLRTWDWRPALLPHESLLGGTVRLTYQRGQFSLLGGVDRQRREDGIRRTSTNVFSGLNRRF